MSETLHDEVAVLARLRAAWDQALLDRAGLEVRIQMLTPDGQPGQPLAYDIFERTDASLATYTLVELPEAVNEQLGLAAVGPDEAREALHGLAAAARDVVSEDISETVIGALRPSERLGVTWGFHRLADGGALLFETDYRHWFASERLLAAQREATGVPWARLRLTLAADGSLAVSFE